MNLIDDTKVLDKTNPALKHNDWEKIHKRYNVGRNEGKRTKKQIMAKHQNYKAELRKEKSKMIQSMKKTGTVLCDYCL